MFTRGRMNLEPYPNPSGSTRSHATGLITSQTKSVHTVPENCTPGSIYCTYTSAGGLSQSQHQPVFVVCYTASMRGVSRGSWTQIWIKYCFWFTKILILGHRVETYRAVTDRCKHCGSLRFHVPTFFQATGQKMINCAYSASLKWVVIQSDACI